MIGFLVDERPHVFVHDADANLRFLQAIDTDYWIYQANAHAPGLEAETTEERQRAAAALRVAYSQGLETLFALIGALAQCPRYPLAWLSRYTNRDLRAVVRKINQGMPFPCALKARPSWRAIADGVHEFVPEPKRAELTTEFGDLWRRLAREFLEDYFEPEYNSLKHGMRAAVGGFSVAVGREDTPGQPAPAERMQRIGGSEHGSTFWMPPRKLDGTQYTFELSRNVSCGWVPQQFVCALPLIGMSISNVAGRALIASGVAPTTVRFVWPANSEAYEAPWREFPSIRHIGFGHTTDLPGWQEPSIDDIKRVYEANATAGNENAATSETVAATSVMRRSEAPPAD